MVNYIGKEILLVEDEAIIAMTEKAELESYGYTVEHALCGEDAIDAIRQHTPLFDLILMDIDLGNGIDGTEAARQILEIVEVPIVFLSSHTEPDIVNKTETITSYGYVVKNSGITVLDASIKMAFKLFNANQLNKRTEEALQKQILALTQPFNKSDEITFEELFNLEDIQKLQDEFASAAGIASIITHNDGTPITSPSNFCRLCNDVIRKTEKGKLNCFKSDAYLGRYNPEGPVIQLCLSGGLWDAGASISVGGNHIASWLIGQVRDSSQSEEKIRSYARIIGADEDLAAEAFREVPAMSNERFTQISQALFTLANLLSNIAYQNIQQARFITDRKAAENEIKKQLKEKELLLKEVHHRIKNNIASISSLLNIKLNEIDDLKSKEIFQNTILQVEGMEVLYSKLLRADKNTDIPTDEFVCDLLNSIESIFTDRIAVSIQHDIEPFSLDSSRMFPLGMIINELVTNSIQHGYDDKSSMNINLSLKKTNKNIFLSVQDSGKGLPDGFNIEESTGFGLMLVKMLADQLEGSFSIKNKNGTVSTVVFEI